MESSSIASYKKWVSLIAVSGFGFFAVYSYFFGGLIDAGSLIVSTNLFFYGLVFIFVLASVVLNSIVWHLLLSNLSVEVSFRKVFGLGWVGIFLDAIVPGGWFGDISKVYLLSKEPGVDGGKTAASVVLKNVLDVVVNIGVSILGLVLLVWNYTVEGTVLIAIGAAMLVMVLPLTLVIYLGVNVKATKKVLTVAKRVSSYLQRKNISKQNLDVKMEEMAQQFHDGIAMMKTRPKALVLPTLFSILAWICDTLAVLLVFASVHSVIAADKVIITNTIVGNLQSQGFAFAGFASIASSATYAVLGISQTLSTASTLLGEIAAFWFKVSIAFFAFECAILDRCLPCLIRQCRRGKNKSCNLEAHEDIKLKA